MIALNEWKEEKAVSETLYQIALLSFIENVKLKKFVTKRFQKFCILLKLFLLYEYWEINFDFGQNIFNFLEA